MHGSVTSRKPQIAWTELEAIVGPEHLHVPLHEERIAGMEPLRVAEPADESEVARALCWANTNGLAVAPQGGGTKADWGNPLRQLDLVISTGRLNRVVEHAWADMTATVDAGCTLSRVQEQLATHGQRLALDALWPAHATVGGVLATNDSGSLRIRFGGLRDLVIGVTVALPDGTLARSGGKVVKNVAGYDLPKLMTGSLGTLAIITQAIFRLHPLPQQSQTLEMEAASAEAANAIVLSLLDSQLAHTGLQMCISHDEAPRLCVRLEGIEAGIQAQAAEVRAVASGAIRSVGDHVWQERERLFEDAANGIVCKISVLPSQLGSTCHRIAQRCASRATSWRLVAQGTGVATLRMDGGDPDALSVAAAELRSDIEAQGGSLVLLHQPAGAHRLDAWGTPGNSFDLMRRIKAQFDAQGTLNPGRFVGGI